MRFRMCALVAERSALSQPEAAELLGVCGTFRRWRDRHREEGETSLLTFACNRHRAARRWEIERCWVCIASLSGSR